MKWLPTTNTHTLIWILSFSGITALSNYLLIPPPQPPETFDNHNDKWNMPTLKPTEDPNANAAKLREFPLWGKDLTGKTTINPATGTPVETQPIDDPTKKWKLIGIISEDNTRYAIIENSEKKAQRYPLTATLPDNTTITAIYENMIEIHFNEQTKQINLYD